MMVMYKTNWTLTTEARERTSLSSQHYFSNSNYFEVNCFTLKLNAKEKYQNKEGRKGRVLFQTLPVFNHQELTF